MAKFVQEIWACINNKVVQRRPNNDGKEDKLETWLDYMQPVIYKFYDHDITSIFISKSLAISTC